MTAIASLRLQNFRNYEDASFEFEKGVNIIVGPNASGKTNLLEAVLMLASGGTYRGRDQLVIGFDKSWARLDGFMTNGDERSLKLEPKGDKVAKTFIFDGKQQIKLSPKNSLPVVVFEPNHLQLIAGEPIERRDYLDDLATKLDQGLGAIQKRYKRILYQRNRLLKSGAEDSQFFVWDLQLAETADAIVLGRQKAIHALNNKLTKTYRQLGGKTQKIELRYSSKLDYGPDYTTRLLARLKDKHEAEKATGFTLTGPHRDDFLVSFDGVDARERASRGEIRSLLLALKIIELELFGKNHRPFLLLDDVFSELDGRRRKALAERLKNYQTFITTTDADVVVEHFQEGANIIAMS